MDNEKRKPGRPRIKKRRSKIAEQVIALRERLGENTEQFGARFCRCSRAVEHWEQDRRVPHPLVVSMLDKLAAKYLK